MACRPAERFVQGATPSGPRALWRLRRGPAAQGGAHFTLWPNHTVGDVRRHLARQALR